ncbi:MAG: glycosyltransferase family 2 protein [Ferruginibacter sp.]
MADLKSPFLIFFKSSIRYFAAILFLYVVSKPGISVIIPNYNGKHLLKQVLPAIFIALQNAGLPNELIISDDASIDDSIFFLQSHYPQVKLICNKENRGFSPTINKGIFVAQYDYVLLLNSDVKLSPDYFQPLLRYFEREDTFGVMGRIVGWQNEIIQDAAKYPSFHGAKLKTSGNYYFTQATEKDWTFSMYLSGANAFVDRKKLVALGGFDEIFAPFYVEDFELSLRAWRLGWKCYYEHFSICKHHESITIKSSNQEEYIKTIYYRNKMFMHAIHLSSKQLINWYLQLIPETLIRIVTGRFYYLQSLKMFFNSRNKIAESKEKFNALTGPANPTLTVTEVVAMICEKIKMKDVKRF